MKDQAMPKQTKSSPDEIIASFEPYLSSADICALKAELENPVPPALRVNVLKHDAPAFIQDLQKRYQWVTKPIPYCPTGIQVTHSQNAISQTVEHLMGDYYIQDAASMLPVSLLKSAQPSPLILDMAASPGGKTTHLADISADGGFILANDASTSRLQALRLVLQTWGVVNSAITNFQGELIGNWFPDTFDLILLDAPCSMQNLRPNASHPFRTISMDEELRLAQRQTNLLISAYQALKPGGEMVYSTCTLSPVEDEAVLDAFLKRHPNAQLVDYHTRHNFDAPAITRFAGNNLNPQVINAIRLYPHLLGTSGFFAALIHKPEQTENARQPYPQLDFSRSLTRLDAKTINAIQWQMEDLYGMNLEAIMAKYQLDLNQRDNAIIAVSQKYFQDFPNLKTHTLGFMLGKQINGAVQLSHEWSSRFYHEIKNNIITLPDDLMDVWLQGRDIHQPPEYTVKPSTIVIVKDADNRFLGRAKLLPNRLRNLLPTRLV